MMTSSLLTAKNVIIQGITGQNGRFHTQKMLSYGTHVVAGTSPGKTGQTVEGVPVYSSVAELQANHDAAISIIFVPAPHAKAAILEAISAKIPLIIAITEHIPVHDMLIIRQKLKTSQSILIGPNTPGVLIPGGNLLGIIPAKLSTPGNVAIVSRSGTLTYEAMDLLTRADVGQRYVIGIGGDMLRGTSYIDCLKLFQDDPAVHQILMIGEIGGTDEIIAADYIRSDINKPVYAYIAGHAAPPGVQMGHAGAILGTNQLESAAAKTKYLANCGVTTASSLNNLVSALTAGIMI